MSVPLIKSARFITSAVESAQYPEHNAPEIAFAGRSNVGKSSLINSLVGRKKLVRTSSRPGQTQTINFFMVNEELCFVDLPGYGYAQAPKSVRMKWRPMINQYLTQRKNLKGVVLLLDVRRKPSIDDIALHAWLKDCSKPAIIVATKADKISRNQRAKAVKEIASALAFQGRPIFFSAHTGEGREKLWEELHFLIKPSGDRERERS
jgi:GTP-binding protein